MYIGSLYFEKGKRHSFRFDMYMYIYVDIYIYICKHNSMMYIVYC